MYLFLRLFASCESSDFNNIHRLKKKKKSKVHTHNCDILIEDVKLNNIDIAGSTKPYKRETIPFSKKKKKEKPFQNMHSL